jgi:hypothetical protein
MDNCGDAAMGFQGMGKSTAMGNTGLRPANGKRADMLTHTGALHRSEFAPANPRRVAPQQSPRPLHRITV